MACIVMAYIVVYALMAYIVMAYIVMAYIVVYALMAFKVMAHIVIPSPASTSFSQCRSNAQYD